MSRFIACLAALCCAFGLIVPAAAQAPLRVMTFNVRTTIGVNDGPEAWPKRRGLLVDTIRQARPDVMGTQELSERQGTDIVNRLPDYAWFGLDRRGGHSDEHMGIFYRRSRLTLLSMGNFWLSETPDIVGSNSWHTPYPRMATWGLFADKASHQRFYLFNTHLPYRAEDEPIRTKEAQVLLDQIARINAEGLPLVLTGDFNTTPASGTYALIAQTLTDIRAAAPISAGPNKTFHNWTGTADRRIDWIFERGFTPLSDATLTTHHGTLYPSDHFPVLAVLGWDG